MKKGLLFPVLLILLLTSGGNLLGQSRGTWAAYEEKLTAYRASLDQLRTVHTTVRDLPDLRFYFFGMGDRPKLIYRAGVLRDAKTEQVVRQWSVRRELIVPSEYAVVLETTGGVPVVIREDERGVFIQENGRETALSRSRLRLPSFAGHPYAPILKTLHQEILMHIDGGLPVPNFLVYQKPWLRDATLMAMVLKQTGNLSLIKNWILNLREPFDRNNHGIAEADNPGQVLFLISLVADKTHPLVQPTLDSARQFVRQKDGRTYLEGKTDYNLHPVFQTKWMKYGLQSLGLPDPYGIPPVYDSYSSLFWWAYRDQHVPGKRFDANSNVHYPYLVWAEDHFYGERNGIMTNRDYPLTWESRASDARYPGLRVLAPELIEQKLSPSHTWHAAELFLLLTDQTTDIRSANP